jgi:hypothetical protein
MCDGAEEDFGAGPPTCNPNSALGLHSTGL